MSAMISEGLKHLLPSEREHGKEIHIITQTELRDVVRIAASLMVEVNGLKPPTKVRQFWAQIVNSLLPQLGVEMLAKKLTARINNNQRNKKLKNVSKEKSSASSQNCVPNIGVEGGVGTNVEENLAVI